MRKQINLVLGMVLFLAASVVVSAQSKEEMHAEKKAKMEKEMNNLMADLELDEAQQAEFKALNQKYSEEIWAVKESEADKETKKAEITELKEAHKAEVKALLSDEQYEKYKMHMKKKKDRMKKKSS